MNYYICNQVSMNSYEFINNDKCIARIYLNFNNAWVARILTYLISSPSIPLFSSPDTKICTNLITATNFVESELLKFNYKLISNRLQNLA